MSTKQASTQKPKAPGGANPTPPAQNHPPKQQQPPKAQPKPKVVYEVENLTAIAADIISLNEQIGRNTILLANVHNQILTAPAHNKAQEEKAKKGGGKALFVNTKVLNERKNVAREGIASLIKTVKEEIDKIEEIIETI